MAVLQFLAEEYQRDLSSDCIFLTENIPADIYLFKLNNRNTRTRFEICSKLTIKTLERRH